MKPKEIKLLQQVLDYAYLNVMVCDIRTHEILFANHGALEFSMQAGRCYTGRTCYDYMMHRDGPCPDCNISRIRKDGLFEDEVYRGNRVFRRQGKRIQWNGREAFIEYVEDITAIRQVQRYEEDSKKDLNATLSNIRVGVVVYEYKDSRLTMIGINKAACQLIGVPENRILGLRDERVLELVHPEDRDTAREMLRKLMQPDQEAEAIYRERNYRTGVYSWLLVSGRSVLRPDSAVHLYMTYTDITDQVSLRDKLAEKEQRLKALGK